MHDAIVVTSSNYQTLRDAMKIASDLGLPVTGMGRGHAIASFLICPDGSKEGWETSNLYESARAEWANRVRDNIRIDYVHVRFGESPAYIESEHPL